MLGSWGSRPGSKVQKGEDGEVMRPAKLKMWVIGHERLRRDSLDKEPPPSFPN